MLKWIGTVGRMLADRLLEPSVEVRVRQMVLQRGDAPGLSLDVFLLRNGQTGVRQEVQALSDAAIAAIMAEAAESVADPVAEAPLAERRALVKSLAGELQATKRRHTQVSEDAEDCCRAGAFADAEKREVEAATLARKVKHLQHRHDSEAADLAAHETGHGQRITDAAIQAGRAALLAAKKQYDDATQDLLRAVGTRLPRLMALADVQQRLDAHFQGGNGERPGRPFVDAVRARVGELVQKPAEKPKGDKPAE